MSLNAVESELHSLLKENGLSFHQKSFNNYKTETGNTYVDAGVISPRIKFYHRIKRGSKVEMYAVISNNKNIAEMEKSYKDTTEFPIELNVRVDQYHFITAATAINSHTITLQVNRHLLMAKDLKSILHNLDDFIRNNSFITHVDKSRIGIIKENAFTDKNDFALQSNHERVNVLTTVYQNLMKKFGIELSLISCRNNDEITPEFQDTILSKCNAYKLSNPSESYKISTTVSNDPPSNCNDLCNSQRTTNSKCQESDIIIELPYAADQLFEIQAVTKGEPTKDLYKAMRTITAINKANVTDIIQFSEASQRYSLLKSLALVDVLTDRKIGKKCCFCQDVSMATDGKKIRNPLYNVLLNARTKELSKSYKIKYGQQVEGLAWIELILSVAKQSLTFDLLSRSTTHQVAFSETGCMGSQDITSCESIFVLYNYARLCKIIEHYQEQVEKGAYPELPKFESLDFVLLKTIDEWHIFVEFLSSYPRMLGNAMESLISSTESSSFETFCSKICRFLIDMSRAISSYYHQTKVLLNPTNHQLPLIFARLGLVKALIEVYGHAFGLLGIDPPKQM